MKKTLLLFLSIMLAIWSCKKDEEECELPNTEDDGVGVLATLEDLPYDNLSDYRLFVGELKDMEPNERVLPYDIISHLFTDYALKKRYVWMPEGTSATYSADGELLEFPTGTIIIKNFYYDNVQPLNNRRIMETRLMIRQADEWEFAEYFWNDEQTEATRDVIGQGAFYDIEFIDEHGTLRDINYRLPSVVGGECLFCHKKDEQAMPIGPKPQNMNMEVSYTDGTMNQLQKWMNYGYLEAGSPTPSAENTVVNWEDESLDLELRVRSYIDINCGHCHAEDAHCDYRPMRFAFSETSDSENLGICIAPEDALPGANQSHIVSAGNSARSMMYYRINTADESFRMPLLGRSVIHDEAVEMIEEWINSLNPPCD